MLGLAKLVKYDERRKLAGAAGYVVTGSACIVELRRLEQSLQEGTLPSTAWLLLGKVSRGSSIQRLARKQLGHGLHVQLINTTTLVSVALCARFSFARIKSPSDSDLESLSL